MPHASARIVIITPPQLFFPAAQVMAAAPISICFEAFSVYNAAQKAVAAGLYASTFIKYNTAWWHLEGYCTWLCIPINLQLIKDPITYFQIFAEFARSRIQAAN